MYDANKSDDVPRFIYKKMEMKWARALLLYGSLKIRRLSYYRELEDETGKIGDPYDGISLMTISSESIEDSAIKIADRGNRLKIGDTVISSGSDRLVICAAESLVPEKEELPGYDTWIQIETEPFIYLINKALCDKFSEISPPVFKRVLYNDKPTDEELLLTAFNLSPAWHTKRTQFRLQREVRIGWITNSEINIKFLDLKIRELRHCVKIFNYPLLSNPYQRLLYNMMIGSDLGSYTSIRPVRMQSF